MIRKRLKLQDIKVREERLTKRDNNIDTLVTSIKRVGLLHRIVIDDDNYIISGYRRFIALKQIGVSHLEHNVHFVRVNQTGDIATVSEVDANTERKDPLNREYLITKRREIVMKEMMAEKIPLKESIINERVSKAHHVSRDVVRKSAYRNKKASDKVKEAAKRNEITIANVDNLSRLKKKDQDKILPYTIGARSSFTSNIVEHALNSGIDSTISLIEDTSKDKLNEVFRVKGYIKLVEKYLTKSNSKIDYLLIKKNLVSLKKTINSYQKTMKNLEDVQVSNSPQAVEAQ